MVAMNVWPTDAADGSVANEARWRKMGRVWAPSGVVPGQGGEMAPSLAGTNLTIAAGAAWVDGHYCELLGDQVLTTTANGLAVVRFDPAANSAELLYLDGATVPTQSPTGTWELPIAKIVASAMTDVRQMSNWPSGASVQTYTQVAVPATDINSTAHVVYGSVNLGTSPVNRTGYAQAKMLGTVLNLAVDVRLLITLNTSTQLHHVHYGALQATGVYSLTVSGGFQVPAGTGGLVEFVAYLIVANGGAFRITADSSFSNFDVLCTTPIP
jgi:hypothetical protein